MLCLQQSSTHQIAQMVSMHSAICVWKCYLHMLWGIFNVANQLPVS